MIGQTEVGLLSGKGPLIATFGYEKSDTRLYHFYRSNMGRMMGIEPTRAWFTARSVNHFTTFAIGQRIYHTHFSRQCKEYLSAVL